MWLAGDAVPVELWNGKMVKAKWVNHLQQYRAEVVSVQTVEKRSLTLPDSLVMQKAVQNVVRE